MVRLARRLMILVTVAPFSRSGPSAIDGPHVGDARGTARFRPFSAAFADPTRGGRAGSLPLAACRPRPKPSSVPDFRAGADNPPALVLEMSEARDDETQ